MIELILRDLCAWNFCRCFHGLTTIDFPILILAEAEVMGPGGCYAEGGCCKVWGDETR